MSRRTVLCAAIAAGLVIVLIAPPAAAAPGDLDATFSDDGIATIALGAGAEADDVAVLPNGKVVAVGTEDADVGTGSQMLVVEYNASGKLDHNFGGGDGIQELSFGACTQGRAVAVDGQGRIVVAGVRENCTTSNTVIALARFLPDGSLDHAFGGGDGWAITSLSGNGEYVSDVAIDGSKIVAAGGILPGSSTVFRFLVLRWNSNGTRDHSFNGTGHRVTKFSEGYDEAVAVGVQPDHAIVACGGTRVGGLHERFAAARYTPAGGLDATFGGDGRATVDFGPGADFCTSLALSAGKVVLGGIADEDQAADFAFARLTATGHPDTGFGTGGWRRCRSRSGSTRSAAWSSTGRAGSWPRDGAPSSTTRGSASFGSWATGHRTRRSGTGGSLRRRSGSTRWRTAWRSATGPSWSRARRTAPTTPWRWPDTSRRRGGRSPAIVAGGQGFEPWSELPR